MMVTRRRFLGLAGSAAVAGFVTTGCAAAAAASPEAVASFLSFTENVLASEVATGINAVFAVAWKAFEHPTKQTNDGLASQGFTICKDPVFGAAAATIISTLASEGDVAGPVSFTFVDGGHVTLDSPLAHAVQAVAKEARSGLKDQTLSRMSELVGQSLLPISQAVGGDIGTHGRGAWVRYPTHNGSVEVAYLYDGADTAQVQIYVDGLNDGDSPTTVRQYRVKGLSEVTLRSV